METEICNVQRVTFRVADAGMALNFRNSTESQLLTAAYHPFLCTHQETGDIIATITIAPKLVPFEPQGKELGQFDCGGINHGVYVHNDRQLILITGVTGQPACALLANSDFSQCRLSLFGDHDNQIFGLNNAIMIVFAFAGAYHNILLMHSSVALNDGYGYMFLGKSGTGKSTHTALWGKCIKDTQLLNDDNPAVRYFPIKKQAVIYGTPWSGKTPCYRNISAPLGAITRLQQWPKNIIKQEPKLRAFASVLSSCSTMIWDKDSYDHIIETVKAVVDTTPVFHLKCLPNEAAAQISYSMIKR